MVAGYSGLGKTSFIRTLCGTFKLRASATGGLKNKASSPNLPDDIAADKKPTSPTSPTSPIAIKPHTTKESVAYATGQLERTLNSFEALFEIDEGNEKINLTLVDTPGFVGSDEVIDSHCDEILRYLEYQFDLTLAEERKVRRNPKAIDNQIHACLYFIDHSSPRLGLSDADVRILKRLGTRVNLIPVIARADTLTRAYCKRLKQAILKDAAHHQIQFFQFLSPKLAKRLQQQYGEQNDGKKKRASRQGPGDDEEAAEHGLANDEEDEEEEDDYDEDDWDSEFLEEKAHLQSLVPFTVIAQEEDGVDIRDENGNHIQGREFPWGILNCLDSNHCDLASLRSALLSSHRQELKEITYGYFYEKYRTEKLLARTKSQQFAMQQQQQHQQPHYQQQPHQPYPPQQQHLRNGSAGIPPARIQTKGPIMNGGSSNATGTWEE
ncbi:hypothetical protein BX616_006461 [Lobosporangium transversale]|uniref:Septin-domain-containing protein n=1 Tax=Lobosporangium transversale TaxID=64571 RepID=A0A1Y2H3V6_9FUNG|nr:Septin-domain-containing protein [Lobosporangium transversale]KAF9896944.1 hypothetical protein BX616_006461 [Lobosporangium transversale]ORZ28714.1 Septin-domain-containing protein [Lobosporangium transversale]|eukprot:XP_021886387.1 Septin-domain-containing protein [Lobosporangium transversale]